MSRDEVKMASSSTIHGERERELFPKLSPPTSLRDVEHRRYFLQS